MTDCYRIFSQTPDAAIDPAAIVRTATRFFEADIEVLSLRDLRNEDPPSEGSELTLRLDSARRKLSGSFRVHTRLAMAADYDAAREAEVRGSAGGMGLLAARCPTIWQVNPEGEVSPGAILNLCAVLAAVALGPTLPPDGSTLYGVRGAMERLEALTGRSLSR
jgi:hypothetical protein